MKISFLSKRDTSNLVKLIRKKWPEDIIPKIKSFKVYEIEDGKRILNFENFTAVQINESIILPFLGKYEILEYFPTVNVDMGAVKFVCNGANIMRPGITSFDIFKKDDIVTVKDQAHAKILAVGIAVEDSQVAVTRSKGCIINNFHYISDKVWEAYKEINARSL